MTAVSPALSIGAARSGRALPRALPVAERLSSPRLGLLWLVRLRWHALGGIALAMTLAPWLMGVSVPWRPAFALVSGIALSNLGCAFWARSGRRVVAAAIGALIIADTLLLTAALSLSGGALNPFVTLYVIEVTLAALLLGPGWVIGAGAASVAGYALLLASAREGGVRMGVESALVALAITLGINATLVVRIAAAFRQRQAALAEAQREAAQAEKLASLATLAAGAAHELATPLGTIAVAATELEGLIERQPEQALIEARLIREQVTRCKYILQRLGARAGSEPGELPRRTSVGELFALVRREVGARAQRLETPGDHALELEAPLESLAAVLANLVSNGLQASAPDALVSLTASQRGSAIRFTALDHGSGIEPALLPRLGEPFFTTKEPGQGMGLGLFLAFRFVRAQGGTLNIDSTPGSGTRVELELPSRAGSTA
ncbi:MAG TPA: ATP-binding protein [Polyangiaceae bacterium]|nr:ATP-binding protein [Polyangiaceae bacterium]